jgi:shikimate kinase
VSDSKGRETQKSIVVVGFMAAGKTTIGRRLAERLGLPFLDADREIEKAFGLTVAEIFALHGEDKFRSAEREIISQLIGGEARVLSLGGGAFVDARTRAALHMRATTVWLDPPFDLIVERLARSTQRPLASSKSRDELHRLWEERRASYSEADIRIVTTNEDPGRAVDSIVEQLA